MSVDDTPFALTQIQPPRLRRGAVARARIDRPLADAIDEVRLVALVAPAGFGKTVALAFQVDRLLAAGAAVAWVGVDEQDDLGRVAACLIAALDPVDVPWRISPDALVAAFDGADAARCRVLAGEVANALAATDTARGVIVIDDAHRLRDARAFDFLNPLVERLPRGWCIVLASRLELPAAVARLRATGDLVEFGQDDLRFDLDDVRALSGSEIDRLPAMRPEALLSRTRGWAAGLTLALQARGSRAPLADRHLFDYVAAEVLAQMPAAKRLFLLRCSILSELAVERCRAVTGDPQAGRWLDEIERQGLFASVRGDGPAAVLVLHDLFRDCLDHLLRRERGDELPGLARRAAASEPDLLRRVGYLARVEAGGEGVEALFDGAPALMTAGEFGVVTAAIEQLPTGARSAPQVAMVRGLAAWAQWNFDAMRLEMHRAAAGFAQVGDRGRALSALGHEVIALIATRQIDAADRLLATATPPDGLAVEALAPLLQARAWLLSETGPLDEVAAALEQQFATIEQAPTAVLWYKAAPTIRHVGLPGFHRAFERYVANASVSVPEGASALRGLMMLTRAWTDIWSGRPAAAAALLAQIVDDARWLGQGSVIGTQVALARAFLHVLDGDSDAALAAVELAFTAADALPETPRRGHIEAVFGAVAVRVASAVDRPERVLVAASRLRGRVAHAASAPLLAHLQALEGHAVLAGGDRLLAERIWRHALDGDEPKLRLYGLDIELRVRLADASLRDGAVAAAAALLRPVFDRAEREPIDAAVQLAGTAALARLVQHPGRGLGGSGWLERWHRAAPTRRPAGATSGIVGPPGPVMRSAELTARELEVLARLAAGDSNKLIARAFDLSPFTVKRHVANILDKLGVGSRGQAAAWFHARAGGQDA